MLIVLASAIAVALLALVGVAVLARQEEPPNPAKADPEKIRAWQRRAEKERRQRAGRPIVLDPALLVDCRRAAKVADDLLGDVAANVRPGVTTRELADRIRTAHAAIGLQAPFEGYPDVISASVNEEVINTLPATRALADGDLLKVQVGALAGRSGCYRAWTFVAGGVREEDRPLLEAGREALEAGVALTRAGSTVAQISTAIEAAIVARGFTPSIDWVGHGIGDFLHEPPQIPCRRVRDDRLERHTLVAGQVLSILVLVHAGKGREIPLFDGWNRKAADGKRSVLFNRVVLVRDGDPEVLTPLTPG